METAAYYLALVIVISFPQAFLFWFVMHPFAEQWRRLPAWLTYGIVFTAMALAGWALFTLRGTLLAVHYGVRTPLVVVAVVLYAGAATIAVLRRRHLKTATLIGLPELSAERYPGRLLTGGVYGRLRHPRYLEIMLAFAAFACFVNYRTVWIMLAASVPVLWILIVLEERELERRFGDDYRRYRERVPALVPRFGRTGSP